MQKTSLSWRDDFLPGYQAASLTSSTLIRPVQQPSTPRGVILQVHGYNDYFFHVHAAQAFMDAGFAFYAVDLRRAGRSLKPGEHPHDMRKYTEPGDDIAEAAEAAVADAVAAAGTELPLVLHAHSTGGLTGIMWVADRPHPALAAVVLNGPLFGRHMDLFRRIASHALPVIAAVRPRLVVGKAPSVYSTHLHVSGGGEWEFDTSLKRPSGVQARASWANAVRNAQRRVMRGLNVQLPVLVGRAAEGGPERADNPNLDHQDIVVDVQAIARLTPLIGPRTEALVIEGAVHDLSLSKAGPRGEYLTAVTTWLDRVLT
jgi:alpha-beta hydrolase superfamily lysophospholipase